MCAAASAARSASNIPTSPTPSSSKKAEHIAATGAGTLLAGDLGCLMNMAGKLQRHGKPVQARHVAEVLAGMTDAPRDRRSEPEADREHLTSPAFKENAQRGARRPAVAVGAARRRDRHRGSPPRDGRANAARVRGAARLGARHQEPHAGASRPLSRSLRAAACTAAGGHVHYAVTADEARAIVLDICRKANAKLVTKGKSMIGEEIAHQRFPRGERHRAGRDRSRRIHHPAPPRAALAHHHAGGASHQGADRGGLPPRAHASAGRPQPRRAADAARPKRARSCASASSPPMSASPARISWSPRPARRSSSPTRATAT